MEQILHAVAAIMMLYRNTKVKVPSSDGDTDYFDIVAGVLQGDMLAPSLFIICLEYVLRTSTDKIKDNGFKLPKEKSTIMDTDYVVDIAFLANTPAQAETQLHSLERAGAGIRLHINAHKTECMCFNQKGDIYTTRLSSETSRRVHLPRKQCLINRNWYQHATSQGMGMYR